MPRRHRGRDVSVQSIDMSGAYTQQPQLAIDDVHRSGVMHKSLWLHVMSSDHQLLMMRRAAGAVQCPDRLSILGEHHVRKETDEHCARRTMRQELPALLRSSIRSLQPLRPKPRWFLYEEADGARHDRSLVSEWVLQLALNSTEAAALIMRHQGPVEDEGAGVEGGDGPPSETHFLPIDTFSRQLSKQASSFCAPGLLPAALVDSLSDICALFAKRTSQPLPGCASTRRWRLSFDSTTTLSEIYDAGAVVFDPTLRCSTRRRSTSHAARRLIHRFGAQMNCSAAVLAAMSAPTPSVLPEAVGALVPGSHLGNLIISGMVMGSAYLGFHRLYRAMQDEMI